MEKLMENLINNDKLFNLKDININDINFKYCQNVLISLGSVSYTHLRAHET